MKMMTLQVTVAFDADSLAELLSQTIENGTSGCVQAIVRAVQEMESKVKRDVGPPAEELRSPKNEAHEPQVLDSNLLDGKAVAKLLGVSQRMVWRLKDGGRMPRPIKLGSLVRWKPDEIHKWIAAGCPKVEQRGVSRPRR
jgi:predicted DNA-binding transcriptional regulator AlpA